MPEIEVTKQRRGRAVLIVGEGPSPGIIPWQHVRRHLAEVTIPDLCLIGHHAVGASWTTAQYAVAAGAVRLGQLAKKGVEKRVAVVCTHPDRLGNVPDLVDILSHPATLWIRRGWPRLPAGPMAVWSMAALGYESIYLYGLDGTADPLLPREHAKRMNVWEGFLRQVMRARVIVGGDPAPLQAPKLYRVWPQGCPHGKKDPLADIFQGTVVIPQQRRADASDRQAATATASDADGGEE